MITLLLIGFLLLMVLIPLIIAVRHAPEGYEDQLGFHLDSQRQAVDPAFCSDQAQQQQRDTLGGVRPVTN
jgi:hypothetical protein